MSGYRSTIVTVAAYPHRTTGGRIDNMADMKFVLSGSDTITLSGQTVDKLIRTGDGNAALLYLYILRTGGAVSLSQMSKTFGRSDKDISVSMELLSRLGLLKYDDAAPVQQKEELPEYTAADIKRELDNGSVFYTLVQEIQRTMNKILSSDDLIRLFGIYDSLGLPPEVIFHLIAYCIDENRRRYGPGRMPTMRYIEKVAYTWEREGVLSLELAEQYIKNLESRRGLVSEVKKVLQIKDRELSASERKYVESWIALGFSPEAIELAYDKTVLKTGRLAWSYMDSIINSWHFKELYTVEAIEKNDGKSGPSGKKNAVSPAKNADADLADFERMKKYLQKLREE